MNPGGGGVLQKNRFGPTITANPQVRPWVVFTETKKNQLKKVPQKVAVEKKGFAGVRTVDLWNGAAGVAV